MLPFFMLLLGIVALTGWIILLKDWRDSVHWKPQEATVRAVSIEEKKGSVPERFRFYAKGFEVKIAYVYEVNQQRYLSKRFGALREPFFLTRQEAEIFTKRFPISGVFKVLVDPEDPTQALAERRLHWFDWMPGIVGITMVLIGLSTIL